MESAINLCNKYWKDWIESDAPQSPKNKNVNNLDKRIERLENYERWGIKNLLILKRLSVNIFGKIMKKSVK